MPENKENTKKNDNKTSPVRALFLLYFITFVIVLILVIAFFAIALNSQRIINFFQHDSYTYQLGEDKQDGTVTRVVSDSQLFFDGVLYFSMDDISSLCELTVTGDFTKRTYFPADDDTQYVTFFYSSDKIIINGETTNMKDIMFEKNGVVYVPASFFYSFSSGISINVDYEKNKITVSRISIGSEYNTLGEEQHIYQDISFMSGSSNVIEHLNDKEVFANTSPVDKKDDDADNKTDGTQSTQDADNKTDGTQSAQDSDNADNINGGSDNTQQDNTVQTDDSSGAVGSDQTQATDRVVSGSDNTSDVLLNNILE